MRRFITSIILPSRKSMDIKLSGIKNFFNTSLYSSFGIFATTWSCPKSIWCGKKTNARTAQQPLELSKHQVCLPGVKTSCNPLDLGMEPKFAANHIPKLRSSRTAMDYSYSIYVLPCRIYHAADNGIRLPLCFAVDIYIHHSGSKLHPVPHIQSHNSCGTHSARREFYYRIYVKKKQIKP